jgi:hypothetical protein
MRFEDIPDNINCEIYQNECDFCGLTLNVLAKQASMQCSETIYFQCDCGNWMEFEIAIN